MIVLYTFLIYVLIGVLFAKFVYMYKLDAPLDVNSFVWFWPLFLVLLSLFGIGQVLHLVLKQPVKLIGKWITK